MAMESRNPTTGERIRASRRTRIAYRAGVPVAVSEAGLTSHFSLI